MRPGEVVWWEEEPERKRTVVGLCRRCGRSFHIEDPSDYTIVSPAGLAHGPHWLIDEITACGINATGRAWWWPT